MAKMWANIGNVSAAQPDFVVLPAQHALATYTLQVNMVDAPHEIHVV